MSGNTNSDPDRTDTGAQGQSAGIGADAAMLAQLDAAYQTHCPDCFMGTLEWCEGKLAPNGQRCATTDAELLMYFRDVANRLLQQRDAADAEHAALTARLAAVEARCIRLERARGAALALWSADAAASEAEPDEYATVAEWGALIEALEACDGG